RTGGTITRPRRKPGIVLLALQIKPLLERRQIGLIIRQSDEVVQGAVGPLDLGLSGGAGWPNEAMDHAQPDQPQGQTTGGGVEWTAFVERAGPIRGRCWRRTAPLGGEQLGTLGFEQGRQAAAARQRQPE